MQHIFDKLGIDEGYLIIALFGFALVLLILNIVNIRQIKKMKKNYETFLSGKDALSLEECLIQKFMEIDANINQIKKNREDIELLMEEKQYAYSKIGLVHYDAFGENVKGKLSFSMAILNDRNDGFVLTSIHGKDGGCYIYSKEVLGGKSFIPLSGEEEEAIETAVEVRTIHM